MKGGICMRESIIIFKRRTTDTKGIEEKEHLISILEKENIKFKTNIGLIEEAIIYPGEIAEEIGIKISDGDVWKGMLVYTTVSVDYEDIEKVKRVVPAEILMINENQMYYQEGVAGWKEMKDYLSYEIKTLKKTKKKFILRIVAILSILVLIPLLITMLGVLVEKNIMPKSITELYKVVVKSSNDLGLFISLLVILGFCFCYYYLYPRYKKEFEKSEQIIKDELLIRFLMSENQNGEYEFRNEFYTKEELDNNPVFSVYNYRNVDSKNKIISRDGDITFSELKILGRDVRVDLVKDVVIYDGVIVEVEKEFSIDENEFVIDKELTYIIRRFI